MCLKKCALLLFFCSMMVSCGIENPLDQTADSSDTDSATEFQPPPAQIPTALPIEDIPAGTGTTYFVDPNGNDDNDGTAESPWATIQQAVDRANPGDTILLNSGSYAGARIERSGTVEGWITLSAAPGAGALINAPGPGNKHDSDLEFETWEGDGIVAYWIIDGLEVAGAPNWGIDIRGNEDNHAHHFIISNNRVHDNGLEGEDTGIFTAFTDDVVVEGNESYANGEHGIYLSNSGDRFQVRGNSLHDNVACGLHINADAEMGGDGISSGGLVENNIIYENGREGCAGINMDGVTDTIVRNNLITDNHASGIAIFQENGAVCSQNIQVLNNTIIQAEDARWAIIILGDDCPNNKIFNNIILNNHEWKGSISIPYPGISGLESDYNIVMDRFSADDEESVITLEEWQALGYDTHSIIATPGALFASGNDYHLSAQSPALDAGRDLPEVTADIEGAARPQNGAFDIGAYEYGGAPAETAALEPTPSAETAAASGSSITYSFGDRVYRLGAGEGAQPEDISAALDQLSVGHGDALLNISPDGRWLILETERFDPDCAGWSCLVLLPVDLSAAETIRASGEVVHGDGIAAVASGGNLIVYSAGDGPHELDLWSVTRVGDGFSAPLLLTDGSPYPFNHQPAISADGRSVVFDCGPGPYAGAGAAICEVSTLGSDFRVVLTPQDAPPGLPISGGLHNPDFAPDGSIVFEGDWGGEQIWRLPPGSAAAQPVSNQFNNDNSPCVLPDGRIVSLWLDRPDGSGVHELKVMEADGRNFQVLLPGVDILDAGLGCGG